LEVVIKNRIYQIIEEADDGDIYPVTILGKVLASIIAISGIGLVALLTGILSLGFMEGIQKKEKKCLYCGKDL